MTRKIRYAIPRAASSQQTAIQHKHLNKHEVHVIKRNSMAQATPPPTRAIANTTCIAPFFILSYSKQSLRRIASKCQSRRRYALLQRKNNHSCRN
ncbi:hypothetical protein PoB_003199100 [Plakobranchus ocellatus]|uniref:Uncharacterized protein n=1 Tax=Plakobranchus ocellatus TaxID=259542 RepID=A0AAV4A2M7_9GAST|nr:hypothetical protein PoB_003199100 [Plakobranchus ocellatus]